MTLREVRLRFQGIIQSEAPIRRATHMILSALGVKNPDDILKNWPLPFDVKEAVTDHDEKARQYYRLKKLIELKQIHGSPTA